MANSYLFYRLRITEFTRGISTVATYASLAEWCLFDGNTDVAKLNGCLYSASTTAEGNVTNLFDGNTSTFWHSAVQNGLPAWVQVQLPTARSIDRYSICPRNFMWEGYTDRPIAWELLASNDGTNWDTLDSRSGMSSGWAANTYRDFKIPMTPSSYLEYIEANGYQYLNTGIYPSNTTKLIANINLTSKDGAPLFGYNGNDNSDWRFFLVNGTCYFDYNSARLTQGSISMNTDYEVELGNNYVKLNGTTVASGSTQGGSGEYTTHPILVFGQSGGVYKGKIYGLKIYNNNALVFDGVPALDGNNVAGLYDKISSGFFKSLGSQDFIAGAVIASRKYLLRDGSNNIWTISGNTLTQVTGTLNAQMFQDHGMDAIPNWSYYSSLSNPTLLCWDSDALVDMVSTTIGLPSPQSIISAGISVIVANTDGIENLEITDAGVPKYAFSVDDGTTWKVLSGGAWVTSSGVANDMSSADIEAITKAQWDSLISGATFLKIRFTLFASTDNVTSITIHYAAA